MENIIILSKTSVLNWFFRVIRAYVPLFIIVLCIGLFLFDWSIFEAFLLALLAIMINPRFWHNCKLYYLLQITNETLIVYYYLFGKHSIIVPFDQIEVFVTFSQTRQIKNVTIARINTKLFPIYLFTASTLKIMNNNPLSSNQINKIHQVLYKYHNQIKFHERDCTLI